MLLSVGDIAQLFMMLLWTDVRSLRSFKVKLIARCLQNVSTKYCNLCLVDNYIEFKQHA